MGFDEVFESRHSQVLITMKRPESGGLKVFCIIAEIFLRKYRKSINQ